MKDSIRPKTRLNLPTFPGRDKIGASSPAVRKSMQGNRGKNTKPELLLRRALWSQGLRGYRLDVRSLPGRPDITYTKAHLAVLVHGCYWHRCPLCALPHPKTNPDFWEWKFFRNRERDERKERELKESGWKVLVLWECEIKKDVEFCVERVAAALKGGHTHG